MIDLMLIDLILIFFIGAIIGALVLLVFTIKNSIGRKKMQVLIQEEKEKKLKQLKKDAKGRFVKKDVKVDMTIYDKDIEDIWVNVVASLVFSSIAGAIGTALFTIIKMVI